MRERRVSDPGARLRAMSEEWLSRWREGRTAFHEGKPNAMLEQHRGRLAGAKRVLVPLCGRAEDLAYLAAHGHEVVGVELAEQAVREFFERHALVPEVAPQGALTAYRAGAITILAGDMFAVTPDDVGPVDGLYDRAALIALPPELRPRYVQALRALLPVGAPGLVITLEYPEGAASGPPFSVLESELRALYAGAEVEWLEDRANTSGRLAQASIPATERGFAVRLVAPRS